MTATKQQEKRVRKMAETKNAPIRMLEPADIRVELAKDSNAHLADAFKDAQEVKDSDGRVISLVGKDIRADILTATMKSDDKQYDAEYVAIAARTVEGAVTLLKGSMDETFEGEGDERKEKPSVVKYFNQGFGILARNGTAAKIRAKLEGPDKALMSAAKAFARARGWEGEEGVAKALAKIKALQADE